MRKRSLNRPTNLGIGDRNRRCPPKYYTTPGSHLSSENFKKIAQKLKSQFVQYFFQKRVAFFCQSAIIDNVRNRKQMRLKTSSYKKIKKVVDNNYKICYNIRVVRKYGEYRKRGSRNESRQKKKLLCGIGYRNLSN